MAEILNERIPNHTVTVLRHRWLSEKAFELVLQRPRNFSFKAGQKILLELAGIRREYSLASSPHEDELTICIRFVKDGALSTKLANVTIGESLEISDAYGFFVYRPGRAVFVATGTGVAPFAAYAKSGIRGHVLVHGVRDIVDLYYRDILQDTVKNYVPCLTENSSFEEQEPNFFFGRVTTYLASKLPKGKYDFYLCGNGAMIRDATVVIDRIFPDSRLFSEVFYTMK